jgi:hypothetical protein
MTDATGRRSFGIRARSAITLMYADRFANAATVGGVVG